MDPLIVQSIIFGWLVRALVGIAKYAAPLALIVGYAGTDFLEGLYKIKKAQRFEI